MPSDIGDYIQTFMGLKQLQNQTQQVAEEARRGTMSGVNTFLQLARQTAHPGELAALADRFAELGVASRDQLTQLLTHVTPTGEALQAAQTQFGIGIAEGDTSGTSAARSLAQDTASNTLTGQSRAQRAIGDRQQVALGGEDLNTPFSKFLNQAFLSNQLAGMSPGKATIDALIPGLPAPVLEQAARIQTQTSMSAQDNAQMQAQQANNKLGYAQLAAQSAYQMGSLEVEMVGRKAQAMAAAAKASGLEPQDFVQLITAKTQLIKAARDAQNKNPTPVEADAIVGGLNAINQRMKAAGLPYEPPIAPGALMGKTMKDIIKGWFE